MLLMFVSLKYKCNAVFDILLQIPVHLYHPKNLISSSYIILFPILFSIFFFFFSFQISLRIFKFVQGRSETFIAQNFVIERYRLAHIPFANSENSQHQPYPIQSIFRYYFLRIASEERDREIEKENIAYNIRNIEIIILMKTCL